MIKAKLVAKEAYFSTNDFSMSLFNEYDDISNMGLKRRTEADVITSSQGGNKKTHTHAFVLSLYR